jgi:hypothetical protein
MYARKIILGVESVHMQLRPRTHVDTLFFEGTAICPRGRDAHLDMLACKS